MKYLILAEKPSAMRSFSTDLGGTSGHVSNFDYELVAAHGHLMGLAMPEFQSDNVDFQDKVKKWSDITAIPWPLSTMKWTKTYIVSTYKGKKTSTKKTLPEFKMLRQDVTQL